MFSPVPLKLTWENGYYLIVLRSLFPNTWQICNVFYIRDVLLIFQNTQYNNAFLTMWGRVIDISTCAPSSAHLTLITTLNLSEEKLAKGEHSRGTMAGTSVVQDTLVSQSRYYALFLASLSSCCWSGKVGGGVKDNMCVKHICHTEVCGFFLSFQIFYLALKSRSYFTTIFQQAFLR